MFSVNGIPILAEVRDVLDRLQAELHADGINLLKHIKPTVGNIMITCPIHESKSGIVGGESHPSMGVLTEDKIKDGKFYRAGTCNCFQCHESFDITELVSICFGLFDGGAYGHKWILDRFVMITLEHRQKVSFNFDRPERKAITGISEDTLDAFRYIHPYMYERKLTDKVIEYFDVGYDEKTGSLTFPVHDLKGRVRLIQRRSVQGKNFLNDQGAEKGDFVYGLYQVMQNLDWVKRVYICESPIDALTCWTYGIAAVATMGSKITTRQIEQLRNCPIREWVIATDDDSSGEDASNYLYNELKDSSFLYRLQFPEGAGDINKMSEQQFKEHTIIKI